MRFLILLFSLILALNNLSGQINPNGIPIKFNAGDWKLVNDDFGMCILGHNVIAGAILIIEHGNTDIEALKKQLESGYEEEGMQLFPSNNAELEGDNKLFIRLSGNAQGNLIKGEAIGLLSDNNFCKGVILLMLTQESADNSKQKAAIKKIAESITYHSPVVSAEWTQKLSGNKLISRDSYSTSTSSPDGSFYTGGNSSNTTKYIFCSDKSFYYSNSSYTALSGSGLDGNTDTSKDSDTGTWSVIQIGNNTVVKFMYSDGTVVYHPISREEGFYYMAGDKFNKGPSDHCN